MKPDLDHGWDFSKYGRARVAAVTIVGTLLVMAFALLCVGYIAQFTDDATPRALMYGTGILLPLIMSAPIFHYFASKLRDLAIANREITEIASRDGLTTCLNRGAFITLVDAYLSQVNAAQPVRGSLLMVDADHFKSVNDDFGHSAGDQALRIVAAQIKSALRPTDLVGRVGGEEFAVFLPQTDLQHARTIAERIRQSIEQFEFTYLGRLVPLTVSVGGVSFSRRLPFEQIFQAADALLYEAKRNGRNRVEFSGLSDGPRQILAS